MSHPVCPWWLTPTFDNPLRRLLHDPRRILAPYVRAGMHAADVGCGMGYFTVALAELVGPDGGVTAIDLQPQHLKRVRRRAERAGVAARVSLVQASADRLGLAGELGFVLAFWMVHEVPDRARLFAEVRDHLAADGALLIVEPKLHVSATAFATTVSIAEQQGLAASPAMAPVGFSRAMVFKRL